jgi:hypothetical protein
MEPQNVTSNTMKKTHHPAAITFLEDRRLGIHRLAHQAHSRGKMAALRAGAGDTEEKLNTLLAGASPAASPDNIFKVSACKFM